VRELVMGGFQQPQNPFATGKPALINPPAPGPKLTAKAGFNQADAEF